MERLHLKRVAWEHRAKFSGAPPTASVATAPLERARQQRRTAGDAARNFWSRTRNRRLGGFKFKREVPLGPYIADFLCPAARLVVEIDGDQHAEAAAYDAARTRYLERCGYAVMRVPTHEVLHEIELVLERVHQALEQRMRELRTSVSHRRPSLPKPQERFGPLLSHFVGEKRNHGQANTSLSHSG